MYCRPFSFSLLPQQMHPITFEHRSGYHVAFVNTETKQTSMPLDIALRIIVLKCFSIHQLFHLVREKKKRNDSKQMRRKKLNNFTIQNGFLRSMHAFNCCRMTLSICLIFIYCCVNLAILRRMNVKKAAKQEDRKRDRIRRWS